MAYLLVLAVLLGSGELWLHYSYGIELPWARPDFVFACERRYDLVTWSQERLIVAGRRCRTRDEYLEESRLFRAWWTERSGREATLSDLTLERADSYVVEAWSAAAPRGHCSHRATALWQDAYGASSGHLDTVFGWQPNPVDVKSGHYIKPTLTQLLIAHQTQLSPLDRLAHRVGLLPLG